MLRRPRLPKVVLVSSFGVYGTAGIKRGALVDEDTPLEPNPERRDTYSQAKLRQEKLFRAYQERHGFPLVVVRPGVIYGPGGTPISSRVGLTVPGLFLHLGGRNLLPLTYVDNCAEAIVVAGERGASDGQAYNVVDDDLPTCAGISVKSVPCEPCACPTRSARPYLGCASATTNIPRVSFLRSSPATEPPPPGVGTASATPSSSVWAGSPSSAPTRDCGGRSPVFATLRVQPRGRVDPGFVHWLRTQRGEERMRRPPFPT